jgi:hypothetical protein
VKREEIVTIARVSFIACGVFLQLRFMEATGSVGSLMSM